MAEALALIGLASSIVQFVAFGAKVVERLEDFRCRVGDVPKAFQAITIELPLLLQALKRTETQVKAVIGSPEELILEKVVQDCHSQVELLDEILIKTLPETSDNSLRRGRKAFQSLRQEGKVRQITKTLGKHVQLLTYYHTSGLSEAGSTPSVVKAQFMVPFIRDDYFIDRKDLPQEIHDQFSTRRRVALAGIGGVGKSQIAIEYCYRYKNANPDCNVFWAHAGTVARFNQAYKDIARKLCLPGWNSPQVDVLQLVSDWLNEEDHGHWLLVIDNADDGEIFFGPKPDSVNTSRQTTRLVEYIPKSLNGSVLITTRDIRVGELLCDRRRAIVAYPLDSQEAEMMLQSKVPVEKWNMDDAHDLLSELDSLPLAITQAAAFITDNYITIEEYLNLFRESKLGAADLLSENLQDPRRDLDTPNSVIKTWKVSFDLIREKEPRAADTLSLMAVLDRQGIPKEILSNEGQRTIDLTSALGTLQAFSLLIAEKGGTSFEMHRLVQLSTRKWLEARGDITKWQQEALMRLSNAFPHRDNYNNQITYKKLLPHVQAVLQYQSPSSSDLMTRAVLLENVAWYSLVQGLYPIARCYAEEAFTICENKLGTTHRDTLESANCLAATLCEQGEYESAERLHRQTLEYREQILGPEHRATLDSMNNLGLVLKDQEKYQAAEELHRKVLYVQVKKLGLQHTYTLETMTKLALVLRWQGNFEAAEQMHRDVLKVREKKLGPYHVNTIVSMHSLALVLKGQGNLEAAEQMLRQVLKITEGQLSPQHPNTIGAWYNLGIVLEEQGKLEEALQAYQQASHLREQTLGLQHPHTLAIINRLGSLLSKLGKNEAAEALYRRVLEDQKKRLGTGHSKTLWTLYCLGFIIRKDLTRNTEAEAIFQEALGGMEKTLGMIHKDTLSCVYELAYLRYHQKDYDKAIELMQRARDGFEETLGAAHDETQDCVECLSYFEAERARQAIVVESSSSSA